MNEKLNAILHDRYKYRDGTPSLLFECLDIRLLPNEKLEGSFSLEADDMGELQGAVISHDIRLRITNSEFSGVSVQIGYTYDGTGLAIGEKHEGSLIVITNAGEVKIPYTVRVEKTVLETSIGPVNNMFQFANLCKTSWHEGVSCFYSERFHELLTGNEAEYYNLYRGLSEGIRTEQRVEEFLISIRKKQPVTYSFDRDCITEFEAGGIGAEPIVISKNGWGYIHLNVSIKGDFITSEKSVVREEDFLGNICHFPLFIDNSKLHRGNNLGEVRFCNEYVNLVVPVCISSGVTETLKKNISENCRFGRSMAKLVDTYVSYCLMKKNSRSFYREMDDLVESMRPVLEKRSLYHLMKCQLEYSKGKNAEGLRHLEWAEKELDRSSVGNEVWCYYMYLTTFAKTDRLYVDVVREEIENYLKMDPDNWRIAWLLMYTAPESFSNPHTKWKFLELIFLRGTRSPVWMYESYAMILEYPQFMMKSGEFTLAVLNFAARRGVLNDEMVYQACHLASKCRVLSPGLVFILEKCCEFRDDLESLQLICEAIVRNDCRVSKAEYWVLKGINAGLRIAGLYEKYLDFISDVSSADIPKIVLMYFTYSRNLVWDKLAKIYAYITGNREEFTDLFVSNYHAIVDFALKCLAENHVDENIALLCDAVLYEDENVTMPASFGRHLFLRRLTFPNDTAGKAIVVHRNIREEGVFTIVDRHADVLIYDSDSCVLFEDDRGSRISGRISYVEKEYFNPEKWYRNGAIYGDELGEKLYVVRRTHGLQLVRKTGLKSVVSLLASDIIAEGFRAELALRLWQYYRDNGDFEDIVGILQISGLELLSSKDRADAIELMILNDDYEDAYETIRRFGTYELEPEALLKILENFSRLPSAGRNFIGTIIAARAFFRGKYSARSLRLLSEHFSGSCVQKYSILRACEKMGVDDLYLAERLLLQMVYSQTKVSDGEEVFRMYAGRNGRSNVIRVYIKWCCHQAIVGKSTIEHCIFEELKNILGSGEEPGRDEMIAVAGYVAMQRHPSEEDRKLAADFVASIAETGDYCDFFEYYYDEVQELQIYEDRIRKELPHSDSRYGLTKQLAEAEKRGDSELLAGLLERYSRRDYLTDKLFTVK